MADSAEDSPVSADQLGERKQTSKFSYRSFEEFGRSNIGSSVNEDQETALPFGTSPTSTRTGELSSRSSIPKPTTGCVTEGQDFSGQSSFPGASTNAPVFTAKTSQPLDPAVSQSGSESVPDDNLPRKKRGAKSNPATELTSGTTSASTFASFSTHSQGSVLSPAQSSDPLNHFSTPPTHEINYGQEFPGPGQSSLLDAFTTTPVFIAKTSQPLDPAVSQSGSESVPDYNLPGKKHGAISNPATELTSVTTSASTFASFSIHSQGSVLSPAQSSDPLNHFSIPPTHEINFGAFAPPGFRSQEFPDPGQSSLLGASTTSAKTSQSLDSAFSESGSESVPDDNLPRKKRGAKSNPATELTSGTTSASTFASFSTHSQGSVLSPAQNSDPLNHFSTPPTDEIFLAGLTLIQLSNDTFGTLSKETDPELIDTAEALLQLSRGWFEVGFDSSSRDNGPDGGDPQPIPATTAAAEFAWGAHARRSVRCSTWGAKANHRFSQVSTASRHAESESCFRCRSRHRLGHPKSAADSPAGAAIGFSWGQSSRRSARRSTWGAKLNHRFCPVSTAVRDACRCRCSCHRERGGE